MKILGIYDKSGPKYHRILLPLHMMSEEVEITYHVPEEKFQGVDILFLNRMLANVPLSYVLALREKYGFKIVVDLDDHWRLDPSHLLRHHYEAYNVSNIIAGYIQEADAVTVTHERLADEAAAINKNVHIFPNAIPKIDQFLFKKVPDKKIRLFWAGGITHRKDIEILRNPFKRVDKAVVKFVMGGYVKREREWAAMASAFTGGGKYEHELIENLPVHQYYAAYSKCDISIVPLVDNSFNRYKSNLKILEAAHAGCPVVVSHVHPYLDMPNVNYVRTTSDWATHINRLVKDYGFAQEQGAELRNYCDIHFNFEKINAARRELFYHVTGKYSQIREVQVREGG